MDDDHGTTADRNLFPSDAQSHGLVEWSARKEGIPPERHALDACLYSHSSHGSEIAAMTYRRADGLFPGDGPILTRRIGNLWTYAELNRGFRREEYPKILERLAELFTGRYVTGQIPPVPGRGYAVYAGLSALRLLGRESEAVALRFGRIPEARLDDKELALADHALAEDPRKPFGKDGPTLVEMSGTTRIPSGQNLAHVFLVGPFLWPREEANDTHGDGTVIRRVLN